MSQKTIISGCRKINLLALLIGMVAIALSAAYADMTSDGLRGTQAFKLMGYLIYPYFYGLCLVLVWMCARMYRRADSFVCVDAANLFVWDQQIPLCDISSISAERGFIFSRLVIGRIDGSEKKISSLALTRPVSEVASHLKELRESDEAPLTEGRIPTHSCH